ncbi:hypothetical protein J6590_062099, partial [Homalodisca vitripennis]
MTSIRYSFPTFDLKYCDDEQRTRRVRTVGHCSHKSRILVTSPAQAGFGLTRDVLSSSHNEKYNGVQRAT